MSRKHPRQWFYLYASNRHVFKHLDRAGVGSGLIAAMDYFATGEIPDELSTAARIVFDVLREGADEAIADYNAAVEAGKKGPAAKAAKAAERESNPP